MFGWEFPPHISGGLGTACYGMTQALAKKGAEIIFVLPRAGEGGQNGFLRLESASGTLISEDAAERMLRAGQDVWQENVRFLAVSSPLTPYLTPQDYAESLRWLNRTPDSADALTRPGAPFTFQLKGGYGPDLMSEVRRFSRLASAIALRENFDVIHVHDWMTYPAGMLAKALTGKPLVAHIHATEYDRSGENINGQVAGIERAGLLAAEIGANVAEAKRAGLLHDLGKSIDHEVEGSHVTIGVELARKYKESKEVVHAIHAHHNDVEPQTVIACLVQAADAISAARPGARRENLENYIKRLEKLEEVTSSFRGVEKSYAIQAGREVRIIVKPEVVSEDEMTLLAREIAQRIENELEYPGQIKVNVIRETKAVEYAK